MKHTYRSLLISEGWVMTDEVETARIEAAEFFRQMTHVKSYHQKKFNKSGQAYTIYEDTGDGEASQKEDGVHKAVEALQAKNIALPNDMRFYLIGNRVAQNRAFHFDTLGRGVSWLSLGTSAMSGGSGLGISAQSTPGFAPVTKIAIHEIAHSLHAANVGVTDFFKKASQGGRLTGTCPACAADVSAYARNSKKEFVAEVFLGLVVGRTYSNTVLAEYNQLGGPPIAGSQVTPTRQRSNAFIGSHRS